MQYLFNKENYNCLYRCSCICKISLLIFFSCALKIHDDSQDDKVIISNTRCFRCLLLLYSLLFECYGGNLLSLPFKINCKINYVNMRDIYVNVIAFYAPFIYHIYISYLSFVFRT